MISSSGSEYKATKLIKRGKARLSSPFDELAKWIGSEWNVAVLNIVYDQADSLHAPRLQVILEHEEDALKFIDGFNFDKMCQAAIANKFLMLVGSSRERKYDVSGLFVVFSEFSRIAKEESDSGISDEQVDSHKRRIGNPELWEISRCFGHVTFMFYTDKQARKSETDGKKKVYASLYFEMLKQHDEFGYLIESEYAVTFDSKENLDANFGGSWFNYYR